MSREHPQMKIRLPPELKNKVKESAQLNRRSINSEIVYHLTRIHFPERFKEHL